MNSYVHFAIPLLSSPIEAYKLIEGLVSLAMERAFEIKMESVDSHLSSTFRCDDVDDD